VEIINNAGIDQQELDQLIKEEVKHYSGLPKYKNGIKSVEFYLEEGEVWSKVTPVPAEVVRVRRITGYLSNENNFNAAKFSELKSRVTHGLSE
jgi:phosphodiesterase/alkaline phosphatase D-like protein